MENFIPMSTVTVSKSPTLAELAELLGPDTKLTLVKEVEEPMEGDANGTEYSLELTLILSQEQYEHKVSAANAEAEFYKIREQQILEEAEERRKVWEAELNKDFQEKLDKEADATKDLAIQAEWEKRKKELLDDHNRELDAIKTEEDAIEPFTTDDVQPYLGEAVE